MSAVENKTGARPEIFCVIPAAGVGKRMQADCPKQYLNISGKAILQHTIEKMQALNFVSQVVVAVSPEDEYFSTLSLKGNIKVVHGGKERVDSVLAGLLAIDASDDAWVLVHDAARPNVCPKDVQRLVGQCLAENCGGILASPVRDTMKRGSGFVERTEPRHNLWHALTPQFFSLGALIDALKLGLEAGVDITDEASAMEYAGQPVKLVEGRSDNLKVTRPEDLALATFYLNQSS